MKQFFLLLASSFLLNFGTQAQSLSLSSINNQTGFEQTALPNWTPPEKKVHRVCTVRTVGYTAEGAGLLCLYGGVALLVNSQANSSQPNGDQGKYNSGVVLAIGGFGLFCAGFGMAVGGRIHDMVYRQNHRYSLVFPKSNQIGLAYNF